MLNVPWSVSSVIIRFQTPVVLCLIISGQRVFNSLRWILENEPHGSGLRFTIDEELFGQVTCPALLSIHTVQLLLYTQDALCNTCKLISSVLT